MSDKVAGQIGAVALLVPGVEEVEAQVVLNEAGVVESLQLVVKPQVNSRGEEASQVGLFGESEATLSPEEQEMIRSKLSTIIKNLYGFDNTLIQIEFQGG